MNIFSCPNLFLFIVTSFFLSIIYTSATVIFLSPPALMLYAFLISISTFTFSFKNLLTVALRSVSSKFIPSISIFLFFSSQSFLYFSLSSFLILKFKFFFSFYHSFLSHSCFSLINFTSFIISDNLSSFLLSLFSTIMFNSSFKLSTCSVKNSIISYTSSAPACCTDCQSCHLNYVQIAASNQIETLAVDNTELTLNCAKSPLKSTGDWVAAICT